MTSRLLLRNFSPLRGAALSISALLLMTVYTGRFPLLALAPFTLRRRSAARFLEARYFPFLSVFK